jgi:RNA polymerase sigma factor (sigma-70 family)
MTNATAQGFTDHMQVLFNTGTCAGLTDGQLLDRFLAGRDDGGELAFEALVTRHGPMVMHVCRNLLDDPQDVHDAFQAVFLVLARRGSAIRDRDSVASWLYGVAVRVSARARVIAIRRNIRERRATEAARSVASVGSDQNRAPMIERHECTEIIHHELGRLPEKFRAPVVLCYFEGLTHDEAAARLALPVGTVRSRLARARDRLRDRLARRGMTAPDAFGPMANWIVGDSSAATGAAAASFASEMISRDVSAAIARTVAQLPICRTTTVVGGSSASLLLSQGVLRSMMVKKLLIAACTLAPIAFTAVCGTFLARKTLAQVQKPTATASVPNVRQPTAKKTPQPDEIDRLAQQLLEAARRRYDAQRTYYEEGRITLDRFVDASKQLALAEMRIAKTDANRQAVRQRYLDRIRSIEQREEGELNVGRATEADVAEVRERRLEAELDLRIGQRESAEMAAVLSRLNELERKVEQLKKERIGK